MTEKSYNNGISKKKYIYGNDGNISLTVDYATNSYTRYNYDLSGRTASVREYGGTDISSNTPISYTEYGYADKTNYLTNVKHFSPIGTQNISYRYGNVAIGEMPDQVYSVSWNCVEKVKNEYDYLSRLSKRTVNGLATNYTYKDITADKTTTLVKSIETSGIKHEYEYDALGNITSIYDGSRTTTYKYDELNQLTRVNDPYENKTHIYSYLNGNITEDKVYEYTTGNLPEYPESLTKYLYENVTWSDILTGVKKSHYEGSTEVVDEQYSVSSDTIGNITNLNGSTYTWLGRQLQSISNSDNSSTTYSYNADGQRIAKVVNGKDGEKYTYNYYYNGDILAGYKLVISDSEGNTSLHIVTFMCDENGEAFGFNYNGNEYFYVKNAQNDVIAIVNSNNETVATYRYDSWGKLISCEDTSENDIVSFINPYTYRGYYYDSDTQLYYLNSRYYNPELCRFISSDDSDTLLLTDVDVTDKNLFAYCDNNPIMRVDIEGDAWHYIVVAGAFGAVVEAGISVVSQLSETGKINPWVVASSAAFGFISGATSMISMSPLASAGLGAAISVGSYVAEKMIKKEKIKARDIVLNAAVGAVGSLFGGTNKSAKELATTRNYANKVIAREKKRACKKYAAKVTARAEASKSWAVFECGTTIGINAFNSMLTSKLKRIFKF